MFHAIVTVASVIADIHHLESDDLKWSRNSFIQQCMLRIRFEGRYIRETPERGRTRKYTRVRLDKIAGRNLCKPLGIDQRKGFIGP